MTMNNAQVRVINPVLSTFALGYRQQQLVGEALFPRVPVQVSGGQVLEFGRESFRLYNSGRVPGGATKRVQFGYLGKPYALLNKSLEGSVPREHLRDAKIVPGVDMGRRAVTVAMNPLLLELEVEQATLATTAANYDANHKLALAGTDKWSDPASDPSVQFDTAKEAIRSSIGVYPNVAIFSAQAFVAAKNNPKIKAQFQYTSKDSITPEMLAAYFGVDRVEVGKAVSFNDADVATDVWGNTIVLAYVPPKASTMEEPSYGYTYTMEGHPLVEQPYYDNNAKSWIYPVSFERAAQLTGITSGFLFTNVK